MIEPIYKASGKKQTEEVCSNTRVDDAHKK